MNFSWFSTFSEKKNLFRFCVGVWPLNFSWEKNATFDELLYNNIIVYHFLVQKK